MSFAIPFIIVGLISGMVSGAVGIGGGTITVPALVLIFGLTQHTAQGTSLAVMLPPVFIFAVWRYYTEGHVNVPIAGFIALGFIFGSLLGSHFIQDVPGHYLKKGFGFFLIFVGIKMALFKN